MKINDSAFVIAASSITDNLTFSGIDKVYAKIEEAVKTGSGYSLVRFGDGEGRILGYDENISKHEVEHILTTWFGNDAKNIDESKISMFKSMLRQVLLEADSLGIPKNFLKRKNSIPCANIIYSIDHGRLANLIAGNDDVFVAGIHIQLEKNDFLSQIKTISGIRSVYTISCHDVIDHIRTKLEGVYPVSGNISIPGEKKYVTGDNRSHLAMFETVLNEIESKVLPNDLVLIGGGLLGKFYAQKVKQMQGIALDIGSTFDLWAEVPSRGYIRKSIKKNEGI